MSFLIKSLLIAFAASPSVFAGEYDVLPPEQDSFSPGVNPSSSFTESFTIMNNALKSKLYGPGGIKRGPALIFGADSTMKIETQLRTNMFDSDPSTPEYDPGFRTYDDDGEDTWKSKKHKLYFNGGNGYVKSRYIEVTTQVNKLMMTAWDAQIKDYDLITIDHFTGKSYSASTQGPSSLKLHIYLSKKKNYKDTGLKENEVAMVADIISSVDGTKHPDRRAMEITSRFTQITTLRPDALVAGTYKGGFDMVFLTP